MEQRESPMDGGRDLAEEVLTETRALPKLDGVVIGVLVGMDDSGLPLVDFDGNPQGAPVRARSTAGVRAEDRDREIALMFESGDPMRPILLGLIQKPSPVGLSEGRKLQTTLERSFRCELDGERVVLTADREIVLRCGKASITLTRAGKILLRGAYLLSRSSGVNRIKGGSVQIN